MERTLTPSPSLPGMSCPAILPGWDIASQEERGMNVTVAEDGHPLGQTLAGCWASGLGALLVRLPARDRPVVGELAVVGKCHSSDDEERSTSTSRPVTSGKRSATRVGGI